jgi:hypothetical protein
MNHNMIHNLGGGLMGVGTGIMVWCATSKYRKRFNFQNNNLLTLSFIIGGVTGFFFTKYTCIKSL